MSGGVGLRAAVRRMLGGPVRAAVASGVAGLEQRLGGIEQRLAVIERRIGELQALTELGTARAAAANERVTAAVESEARLSRRIDDVAKLLGDTGGRGS